MPKGFDVAAADRKIEEETGLKLKLKEELFQTTRTYFAVSFALLHMFTFVVMTQRAAFFYVSYAVCEV